MSFKQQTSTQTTPMEDDKEEIFEKVLLEVRLENAMEYEEHRQNMERIEKVGIEKVTIYEIESNKENLYLLKIDCESDDGILVYIDQFTITDYGEHIFDRFPLEEGEDVRDIVHHTPLSRSYEYHYTGNKIELKQEEIMSHII